MYLGICINNDDPEKRGRVQIFIPHILPTLTEEWNDKREDIQINCVGDNLEGSGLKEEEVKRLMKILPWAEAASPILGTSAPGNAVGEKSSGAAAGGAFGKMVGTALGGEVGGAAGQWLGEKVGNFYDQSPAGQPAGVNPNGNGGDLAASALGMIGTSTKNIGVDTQEGQLGCAAAVCLMFKNATGQDIKPGRGLMTSTNELYNHLSTDSNFVRVPPDQMQPGDIMITARGSQAGHTGIYVGNDRVVSNNSRSFQGDASKAGTIQNNYNLAAWKRGVTDRNPSQSGVFRYVGPSKGSPAAANAAPPSGSGFASPERASVSADSPSAPVHANPVPPTLAQGAQPSQYGNAANQNIGNSAAPAITAGGQGISGTVSGGGTVSETGVSKEALEYAMRMAAAESGAGVQSSKAVLSEIGDPLVSLGYSARSYGVNVDWNQRHSYDEVREYGKQVTQTSGFNPNKMDIGYTQHNNNDAAAYNLKNSGSYRDQIMSVAQHVQNQMNKNPSFASSLQSGQFAEADKMNAVPGWRITEGNVGSAKYDRYVNAKASLSDRIDNEFGGDPYAALAALDKENPSTASANEMLGTNYAPPAAGSATSYASSSAESMAGKQSTNLVNNTDPHGPVATQNLNNVAKGVFSFPAAGSMLWVFFREGNPLFPVYFAASYSQSEWQSAYQYGSPGPGYNPTPEKGQPRSTGGIMNLNGVGGLRWEDTNCPQDSTKDQRSIMLFGEDGSNMFFGTGYSQIFSKFDRRDIVEGDRWETTLGFKEEWIQGDSNTVTMGDCYIKIGNVSQRAVDAVERIQQIIKEIQAPLEQTSGGGGGSGGSSSAQSSKLPPALQKEIDKNDPLNKLAPDPGPFKLQTEDKVPAYLKQGASQETINQFRTDSKARQFDIKNSQFGGTAAVSNWSFNSSSSTGNTSNWSAGGSGIQSFTNASTVSQTKPTPATTGWERGDGGKPVASVRPPPTYDSGAVAAANARRNTRAGIINSQ